MSEGEKKVFLRKFAMFDRDKECRHESGFAWSGRIPFTGTKKCQLCGASEAEAAVGGTGGEKREVDGEGA